MSDALQDVLGRDPLPWTLEAYQATLSTPFLRRMRDLGSAFTHPSNTSTGEPECSLEMTLTKQVTQKSPQNPPRPCHSLPPEETPKPSVTPSRPTRHFSRHSTFVTGAFRHPELAYI